MKTNIKVSLGRRCAYENRSVYINGPWSVHCLRHRNEGPICVMIVQDTFPDMGLGASIKATDNAIREDKSLKRPERVDESEIYIKDIKNSCSFSEGSVYWYVQTGLSSAIYWR